MKLFLLLPLFFQDGYGGIVVPQCTKSLEVSPCFNCASMFSIKCISGDDFQSCTRATWGCGDNQPKRSGVKCRQDNPGNSCGQTQ